MTSLGRRALVAAGWCSVGLGVVGMVVPLMPTTPFLLLAAVCFSRSSPRFHAWLLDNRWLGAYIRNYREQRGMRLLEKAVTLTILWTTLVASALLVAGAWWVKLLLLAVGAGVTAHLLRLRTIRRDVAGVRSALEARADRSASLPSETRPDPS